MKIDERALGDILEVAPKGDFVGGEEGMVTAIHDVKEALLQIPADVTEPEQKIKAALKLLGP